MIPASADSPSAPSSDRRKTRRWLAAGVALLAWVVIGGCGRVGRVESPPVAKVGFNEHVQPILAEACYHCHGPDPGSRKAGLRLDRAEDALARTAKRGPAIVPGKPDESPLVRLIESSDADERMPPPEAHKVLKPEEIAVLRRWVAEGAEYQPHWAFVAPSRPKVPGAAADPIDAFVRARLVGTGLKPAPEADRRTLIRRVSYDLTGLPPTPAEVEAYLADTAPGAYERVVDRLLASPRFGEHRARYWLDYVRYADTHGLHFDNVRAIWPYRDYVIRAFNANVPFDRFVREQLAGDLLPGRTIDAWVATGFLRCNLTTNEGGTITEEVFVNQTRDRVEAFGLTFLGLTTGCAACHDHKFDPTSARDFYGLAAFLSNTEEKPWDLNIQDPPPVLRLPKDPAKRTELEALLAKRADLQTAASARRAAARDGFAAWLAAGNRPRPVSPEALELRLRLDEGRGDVVRNHAPGRTSETYRADTNPLVWGETSWAWPGMRMDIAGRLPLGTVGDVEADDAFSGGGWIMLRQKPGGGGTGNGTLFSKRWMDTRADGQGWSLAQKDLKLELHLVHAAGREAIHIVAKPPLTRYAWTHVFFTYDGSRRASGVRLFVDGHPVETEVKLDGLQAGGSIRSGAVAHLGRRDDDDPMRETSYQDIRFYRRALAPDEVARLPYEDRAAEIVTAQPDPARWSTDDAFIAADRFFLGQVDEPGRDLARRLALADKAIDELTKGETPTLIIREKPTPAYSDILRRGDYHARVERVEPATPHFLPPMPAGAPRDRRGLAEWLLMPEQPLFARVTVNRVWQEIFGTGLVESSGDFGIMGTRPSHPELLDWLAVEFREGGWDVKALYRRIVTSATYRQEATVRPDHLQKDPANRLLARGPRYRMDGEVLRDAALATAGLLVERIGGEPAKPYAPAGLWEEVAMPESNTKTYVPDTGEGLYRRSVYTFWKRASPPPDLETFDGPSREVVCTRRPRSNTPLQAFVTMNDRQWVEAARHLAERTLRTAGDTPARIDLLARTTLARPLTAAETAHVVGSHHRFLELYQGNPEGAAKLIRVGARPAAEGTDPVELAVWTLVASQFLNLDEFLTK